MSTDDVPPARATRSRRGNRPAGDVREADILDTAARLLATKAFSAISIDDLTRGAGISRPTFYFYFSSKYAVLLSLLDRVSRDADRAMADPDLVLAQDPVRFWRDCLAAVAESFRTHRAVLVAATEARHSNEEIARWCAEQAEGWVTRTASLIDAERARGAAPAGPPARDLAVALNALNDQLIYASLVRDRPAVAEPEVVETLLYLWLTAIYRTTEPTGKPSS